MDVEAKFKGFQTLSTSIQHPFNTFQQCWKGVANAFNIAIQQNRKDVEANVEAVC